MKIKRLHIAILVLIYSFNQVAFSQEIIKVRADGKSISSGNLSPNEARNDAINDAKKSALIKAGIRESISVSKILYSSEDNLDFSQLFNEISVIESDGEIIVDSIIDKSQYFIDDNLVYEVEILATVFKYYTKSDPEFSFTIDGLNEVYFTSEKLSFKFTPSSDGYLKIFNINKSNASLIYPSVFDIKNKLFIKGITVSFPLSTAYKPGYALKVDVTENDSEINNLIFVFTKKDIPISEKLNLNSILEWVYRISPAEKSVQFYGIVIKKS
jgi:hypothetical protein